jgi:hypothetical protein
MDVPEPLKWARVDHPPLVGIEADESVYRIANLVTVFRVH